MGAGRGHGRCFRQVSEEGRRNEVSKCKEVDRRTKEQVCVLLGSVEGNKERWPHAREM